ncbi:MAG TPA: polyphenol oxidase family protein [Actinomycetota bacterium]|nr:polyphenol oxidase family protein [Actinomycetota bacterium]
MTLTESVTDGIGLLTATLGPARVAFSDRNGGVSRGPYASLNLAARGGDDRAAVTENRARVARAAGFPVTNLALARQVHGADHLDVASGSSGVIGEADVLTTRAADVALGILTADCAPVVLVGSGAIGVVHAGWRGVVAEAVARGVAEVGEVEAAWIGPSIHSCCYEVGPEVVDAFRALDLPVASSDRVDPAVAAAAQLERLGVTAVEVSDICTSCDARYYSYRRDGLTGRQGAFVWWTE